MQSFEVVEPVAAEAVLQPVAPVDTDPWRFLLQECCRAVEGQPSNRRLEFAGTTLSYWAYFMVKCFGKGRDCSPTFWSGPITPSITLEFYTRKGLTLSVTNKLTKLSILT